MSSSSSLSIPSPTSTSTSTSTSTVTPAAAAPEEVGHEEEEVDVFLPKAAAPETPSPAAAAAASASGLESESTSLTPDTGLNFHSVATLSSPWQYDDLSLTCTSCQAPFHALNRRHHCRLCGNVFCGACTNQRALIPPSQIVLVPQGGKKVRPTSHSHSYSSTQSPYQHHPSTHHQTPHHHHQTPHSPSSRGSRVTASFTPDEDPDRMLTYLDPTNKTLLYGKGLEERFQLAREPLRVCYGCYTQLKPLQDDLILANSNAMRFNYIDPTDVRRLWNSPLAFTLGHEIRKAAYTLNNLLPLPKRMGALVSLNGNPYNTASNTECREQCSAMSPSLANLDGVRIPARLLEQAKGVAVLTVAKGGLGIAGLEFGTGLVVARLSEGRWSAPSAIGTAGISWGALLGAQVSDHVFLLMNDAAVELLFQQSSVTLGADIGIAVGPIGRAAEADLGVASAAGSNHGSSGTFPPPGAQSNGSNNIAAPIYTYSLSKGLYAGISLDGKMIVTRNNVNEKFYGRPVSGMEILQGMVPTPPAAAPLYEALTRCHVYATAGNNNTNTASPFVAGSSSGSINMYPPQQAFQYQQQQPQQQPQMGQQPFPLYPQPYQQQQPQSYQQPHSPHSPLQEQQQSQQQPQYYYQATPTIAMLYDPDMGEYGEVVSSDNALLQPVANMSISNHTNNNNNPQARPPEETTSTAEANGEAAAITDADADATGSDDNDASYNNNEYNNNNSNNNNTKELGG